MPKVKIRFLMNTLKGGGAEKVLINLLKRMDPETYDTSLIVISGGGFTSEIPEYIHYHELVKCKLHSVNAFFAKIVYKMPKLLFIKFFLKGINDIEIAYLQGFPTRAIASKPCTTEKTIAFIHSDFSARYSVEALYKSKNECLMEYRSFTKVCFVSQKAKFGFEQTIGRLDNALVVHNVVDKERILKSSLEDSKTFYQTSGWKLISVGRLVSEKAYSRLIRIAGELEKNYEFEIWIVGEGEERAKLERLIHSQSIHSVRLMGFQINPYPLMKMADLFICSSLLEGYSTVVTEAMALSLPVITTECAGMDELLGSGEYGMIVENTDDGLKKGLVEIFSDSALYDKLKHSALERSKMMDENSSFLEYKHLFDEVLK